MLRPCSALWVPMALTLGPAAAHSAPGQYLGFALQPVRMCFHLLSAEDGCGVSLEHLDDVAVHYPDGSILVEQAKSALSHNALSDWSSDLWKTIANWLEAIRSGELDPNKTLFHLYVTPTKVGKFANAIHVSDSAKQVDALTKEIRQKLKSRKGIPACIEHLEVFLSATDSERFELLKRITVVSRDDDPLDALRAQLRATVPIQIMDQICEAAIGMAKERADKCIRNKTPALIEVTEFRRIFHAFVKKHNMAGLLASLSPNPATEIVQQTLLGRPGFIRQLQIVDASDDQQLRAVSDYLRTTADKVLWAEQGHVFEDSFDELDGTLLRHHGSIKSEIDDLHSDKSEVVRGRTVYNRCSVLQLPLEGREVPGHFTHGSFHALSEEGTLGWHPRYRELLDKESD